MRNTIIASAILAAVVAIPASGQATAQDTTHHAAVTHKTHRTKASLASQAKITQDSAAKVALGQVANGSVKKVELEKEHGKLIYSFDITVPGQEGVEEVAVNAIDGTVVAHEHESAAKEADEAKSEAKEAKGAKVKSAKKTAATTTPAKP
jgi:uncharacterized membrane protein YkoI